MEPPRFDSKEVYLRSREREDCDTVPVVPHTMLPPNILSSASAGVVDTTLFSTIKGNASSTETLYVCFSKTSTSTRTPELELRLQSNTCCLGVGLEG